MTGKYFISKGRDFTVYFRVDGENAKGSIRGLSVTWYTRKRVPDKAKWENQPRRNVFPPFGAPLGSPYFEPIAEADLPADVAARFTARLDS